MSAIRFEVTGYNFCCPLNEKQWDRLSVIDDSQRQQWPACYDRFIAELKKSGAIDVEFNAHFGRNIGFFAESIAQARRVVRKLEKILNPPKCKKEKRR
jgi:hypothetical protein